MLNLKKVISSSIIIGLVTSSYTLNALADNITVKLNNSPINFDVQPQIINGRTMVPLRAIFESLGATVEWDDANKSVNSKKDNTTVSMTVGNNTMWVNGVAKQLDVPPEIIDGRTLVPARAIAESYGCNVSWDDKTRTVNINLSTTNNSVYTENADVPNWGTLFNKSLSNKQTKNLNGTDYIAFTYEYSNINDAIDDEKIYSEKLEKNYGWTMVDVKQHDDGKGYKCFYTKKSQGVAVDVYIINSKRFVTVLIEDSTNSNNINNNTTTNYNMYSENPSVPDYKAVTGVSEYTRETSSNIIAIGYFYNTTSINTPKKDYEKYQSALLSSGWIAESVDTTSEKMTTKYRNKKTSDILSLTVRNTSDGYMIIVCFSK